MIILFALFFVFYSFFESIQLEQVFAQSPIGGSPATVTGIVPGCGDGIIEIGEQCDGINLNNQNCSTLGFFSGTLFCNLNCSFNTSLCITTPPPPPPPPPGGGFAAPAITAVEFSGRAYPRSTITILRDAQVVANTIADANANFNVLISGISPGNYIFSIYSEDNRGIRSSLLTFSISVTSGVTTRVGGIFIAPTLALDKSEVRRGDNLVIFGQSTPNAEITITINSEEPFFLKTNSDRDGIYLYNFNTLPLVMGEHSARSKGAYQGRISSFSRAVNFLVGLRNVLARPLEAFLRGDVNNDRRVNLVDFSIAAFWHRRPLSDAFKIIEKRFLNGDGKIDLVDFSIMAYHWTG